jgi:hypothetical protein
MRPRLANNDSFLLAGLLFFFLLIPVTHRLVLSGGNGGVLRVLVQAGFCAMMLIAVWSLIRDKTLFRIGMGLAVSSAVFAGFSAYQRSLALDLVLSLSVLSFCVLSGVIAARHVFAGTQVDRNLIYGAMYVYLLMGMAWAVAYSLIFEFWPAAFHGMENLDNPVIFDDFLYFSFITLAVWVMANYPGRADGKNPGLFGSHYRPVLYCHSRGGFGGAVYERPGRKLSDYGLILTRIDWDRSG